MRSGLLKAVLLFGVIAVAYAPSTYACYTCNVQTAQTTVNNVTYTYQTGGCGTPPSDTWGTEDCHSWYQNIANSFDALVECDSSGYGCYYTEVNGGSGGGGGGGATDPGTGPYNLDGSCSAEYSSCY